MAGINQPIVWQNNKNDSQGTSTITAYLCGVAGNFATSATTLNLSGFSITAGQGALGYDNFSVGDEITVGGGTTHYEITAMTNLSADATTGDWSSGTITISPVLENLGAVKVGKSVVKEDSYKGNQGSAENHLRLRRLGYI